MSHGGSAADETGEENAVDLPPPPEDRYHLCYTSFFLLGLGTLFPWNAFITAQGYYQARFRGTRMEDNFENAFAATYTWSNFLIMPLVIRYHDRLRLRSAPMWVHAAGNDVWLEALRVAAPLLASALIFVATALLAYDDAVGPVTLFGVTLGSIVLLGFTTSLLQCGIYGLASRFPPIHLQAIMVGQSSAGLTIGLSAVLTAALSPASTSTPSLDEVRPAAIAYFAVAVFISFACLAAFGVLAHLDYARAYASDVKPAFSMPPSREVSSRRSTHMVGALDGPHAHTHTLPSAGNALPVGGSILRAPLLAAATKQGASANKQEPPASEQVCPATKQGAATGGADRQGSVRVGDGSLRGPSAMSRDATSVSLAEAARRLGKATGGAKTASHQGERGQGDFGHLHHEEPGQGESGCEGSGQQESGYGPVGHVQGCHAAAESFGAKGYGVGFGPAQGQAGQGLAGLGQQGLAATSERSRAHNFGLAPGGAPGPTPVVGHDTLPHLLHRVAAYVAAIWLVFFVSLSVFPSLVSAMRPVGAGASGNAFVGSEPDASGSTGAVAGGADDDLYDDDDDDRDSIGHGGAPGFGTGLGTAGRLFDDIFVPLLFLLFNAGDMAGRLLSGVMPDLIERLEWVMGALRAAWARSPAPLPAHHVGAFHPSYLATEEEMEPELHRSAASVLAGPLARLALVPMFLLCHFQWDAVSSPGSSTWSNMSQVGAPQRHSDRWATSVVGLQSYSDRGNFSHGEAVGVQDYGGQWGAVGAGDDGDGGGAGRGGGAQTQAGHPLVEGGARGEAGLVVISRPGTGGRKELLSAGTDEVPLSPLVDWYDSPAVAALLDTLDGLAGLAGDDRLGGVTEGSGTGTHVEPLRAEKGSGAQALQRHYPVMGGQTDGADPVQGASIPEATTISEASEPGPPPRPWWCLRGLRERLPAWVRRALGLSSSNVLPVLLVLALGVSNGYAAASIMMHFTLRLDMPEDKDLASGFMVCALTGGLAAGSLASYGLKAVACCCNPFS